MEIKRIIPILTILNDDLVKTKFFNQTNLTYIGDILNAVRIFNDKNAEEIIKDGTLGLTNEEIEFIKSEFGI